VRASSVEWQIGPLRRVFAAGPCDNAPMLLDRDVELALLDRLVDDLETSGGRVVLVRGEAAIGKSTLISAFLDAARSRAEVHIGGCDDLLIPQPLGPFWDMARSEPTLAVPLANGDRAGVLEVVLDLLTRSLRPTLIALEDIQWADEATLDAIKYLGRRITGTNGLLLLTYRDGDVDHDHPLRAVIGDIPPGNVVRIPLDGLSLASVTALVAGSGLDPDEVMNATDGNPFLVIEMASAGGKELLPSLEDSVMARVLRLSPGAQDILKTLSVIPEPIPLPDALHLAGADESRLDEGERRGLLDLASGLVGFRHDLIRRAIESVLTGADRVRRHQLVLDELPEETHPGLLIHCAVEAGDIDRLVDLAPRSARYAAATGSHVQAAEDFRQLGPYLDRLAPEALGPILDEWAREELFVDNVVRAVELAESAIDHYRRLGDVSGESGALARAAHYYENAGQSDKAEERARRSVEVLGDSASGPDLARALEANAYLQTMKGNVLAVPELVDRALRAGGSEVDERIVIRSLNHRGIVANIANYPDGRDSLDEAWRRAEASGQWYEESRALFNHAWAAAEARDLPIAMDYVQRAIDSAVRHELPTLESYAQAMAARILEFRGDWAGAEDLATDLLDRMALSRMVALPVLGVLAARRGRPGAREQLTEAWDMALVADENQRLAPAAAALAEFAWLSGATDLPIDRFEDVMRSELAKGFRYTPGSIAFWLWRLGELASAPEGVAEPYRLAIEGRAREAAGVWEAKGVPYERGLALMEGDVAAQLEAIEIFESLGATATAGKLRQGLREQGVNAPRGRSRSTRDHAAGLTARQAEVLDLLAGGLSNTEIADRLFVSLRTVENHVAAVLMKLDVASRGAAVEVARERGILQGAPETSTSR